jgi:His/Glu/Gln/Arg/opine family amino acid ABC transporter permease subunit
MHVSAAGFAKVWKYAVLFKQGLVCTLSLSALTVLFGFFLALLLALCRMGRIRILKLIASIYVEVFRATPMLVQLFIVYYVLFAGVTFRAICSSATSGWSASCRALWRWP